MPDLLGSERGRGDGDLLSFSEEKKKKKKMNYKKNDDGDDDDMDISNRLYVFIYIRLLCGVITCMQRMPGARRMLR